MKKQFFFVLGLLMAVAVQVWSADIYTLTAVKGTTSGYAVTGDVTINGMQWNAPGNQNFKDYWRIGGKGITDEKRVITGKSPMNGAANRMVIQHNGVSKTTVSVSSVKLTVASDAAFTHIVDEVIGSGAVDNSGIGRTGIIQFVPSSSLTEWASQSYYKITFTVSNTSTSDNGGIDFVSATWYTGNDYLWTVTFKDHDGRVIDSQQVINGMSAAAPANPVYEEGLFLGWDTDFSVVQSNMTVTALYDRYASEAVIDNVRVTAFKEDGMDVAQTSTYVPAGRTVVFTSDQYIKRLTFPNQASAPNLTWSIGEATYYPSPRKEYVWTGCTKQVSFKVNGSNEFSISDMTIILSNTNCEGDPEVLDDTKAKVDFYDKDGFTWLKTCVVTKGETAVAPLAPKHDGYTFAYWSKALTNVQRNMIVNAVYTVNTLPDTLQYALPALNGFYDFTGQGKKGAVVPIYGKTIESSSTYNTHYLAATADYTTDFQPLKAISKKWKYSSFYNGVQEHVSYIEDINKDGEMDFSGWTSNSTTVSFLSNENSKYEQKDNLFLLPNCDLNGDGRIDYLRADKVECCTYTNGLAIGVIYAYFWYVNWQQPDGSFVEEQIDLGDVIAGGSSMSGGVSYSGDPSCGNLWNPVDSKAKIPVSPTRVIDMNNDGKPDLVDETNGAIWYQGEKGKWTRLQISGRTIIQDLNNDRLPDFACVKSSHPIVSISKSDGSSSMTQLSNEEVDNELYLYDFNRDGYVDILATISSNNNATGYAYSMLFLNNGNGTFTKQPTQNYTSNKLLFKACQDIDGDGNYDLLAFELDNDNKTTGKVFQMKGNSNATFAAPQELFTVVQKTLGYNEDLKSYKLNVADLDGDGKPEIWASRPNEDVLMRNDITVIKSMNSATANTAPSAPATPQISYNDGKLKISWGNGSDAQTATADLTYALRIGTTPGGNELMNGHALADGTRCNFIDGNMGCRHEFTLDLSTYAPMTIYAAVQAVDAQHMGSAWSQEASYKHTNLSAKFTLDKTDLRINESAKATFTQLPAEYIHEWIVEDGTATAVDGTTVRISFTASGNGKAVTHIIKQGGVEAARATQYINVFPNGLGTTHAVNARIENQADYTMDGIYDIVTNNLVKVGQENTASSTGGSGSTIDPNAITVRLQAGSAPNWGSVCLYAWTSAGSYGPNWPGTAVNQDDDGWWTYTFDASVQNINIIWNNGGGEQTIDITGVVSSTCYALGGKSSGQYTVTTLTCPAIGDSDTETETDPEPVGGASYQFTNAIGTWNANISSKGTWVDHTHNGAIDYIHMHNNRFYALIHNGVNDIDEKREHNDFRYYMESCPYTGQHYYSPRSDINHNGYYDFINYSAEDKTYRIITRQLDGSYQETPMNSAISNDVLQPILGKTYIDISEIKPFHADMDRDGFMDYGRPQNNDGSTQPIKQLTVLLNRGEGQFEQLDIPFAQGLNYADLVKYKMVDLDADGYVDIVSERENGTVYTMRNNSNQSYSAPQNLPLGSLSNFKKNATLLCEDLDNDGYPDIIAIEPNPNSMTSGVVNDGLYVWYMGATGVKQQGFLLPAISDGSNYGYYEMFIRQSDHLDFYNPYVNSAIRIIGASNEAPAVPANVRAQMTEEGLLIAWDAAMDDHTPTALLRYNLSVKKAGQTGEGAYLISPQNGGEAQAAVLPDYDYGTATLFLIPMTALEVRNYEISVQAIDLWDAVSEFSAPITFKPQRSPIGAPQVVCAYSATTVSYVGDDKTGTPVWNFDGGTIVSGSGFGPYSVQWNTAGAKTIRLTLNGQSYTHALTVDDIDYYPQIPAVLFQNQSVHFDFPEGLAPIWYAYIDNDWYRLTPTGFDDEHQQRLPLKIRAYDDGHTITVTNPGEMTITLMLTLRNSNGCEKTWQQSVQITTGTIPTISLVTVDVNAHNVINFNADTQTFQTVRILKETNVLNEFEEVATVPAAQGTYTDVSSNAEQQPDRYKVQGGLGDDIFSAESPVHKTVHATISKGVVDGTFNLNWNAYEGADVVTYNIYRGSSKTSLSAIASVAASATSYTDNAPIDAQPFYVVEYVLSSAASAPARRVQTAAALTGRSNIVKREQLQGIEDIVVDADTPMKIVIDNVIYILRGDKIYTVDGRQVH